MTTDRTSGIDIHTSLAGERTNGVIYRRSFVRVSPLAKTHRVLLRSPRIHCFTCKSEDSFQRRRSTAGLSQMTAVLTVCRDEWSEGLIENKPLLRSDNVARTRRLHVDDDIYVLVGKSCSRGQNIRAGRGEQGGGGAWPSLHVSARWNTILSAIFLPLRSARQIYDDIVRNRGSKRRKIVRHRGKMREISEKCSKNNEKKEGN